MYDEDSYGMKRQELGDKSCEILFAIKKRNKDFSNQAGAGNNIQGGGANSGANGQQQINNQKIGVGVTTRPP